MLLRRDVVCWEEISEHTSFRVRDMIGEEVRRIVDPVID